MNTKKAVLISLICVVTGLAFASDTLNMFLDYNRFLDKDNKTVLLVDYQVPYRNLVFVAKNGGYFAELNVNVEFVHGDSVSVKQEITDVIGITNKADALSKSKTYLNRLSFVLDNSASNLRFSALDMNSQKQFSWVILLQKLSPTTIISDLELNSEVRPDTLQYLAKFHRNKVLYRPEPSILINRTYTDYAYLYLETYHHKKTLSGSNLLVMSLEKDSLLVLDEYLDYEPTKSNESFTLKIPLVDLIPGKYNGTVTLQSGEESEERTFEFVLIEDSEEFNFLNANPDDEYLLMRYFMGNRLATDWKSYDFNKKRRYITQFWYNMAISTKRDVKSIMNLVQDRVDYANKFYGHLASGWTSDMGRIYIRNGAPDDIERDTSTDTGRFVRKDFQIWKYSTGNKPVYVFVDIQMNGNYKLIYADNDDMENSVPDWIRFLGSDFDESRLNN